MENFLKTYVVAGVVIKQDDKYLLVQENRPNDLSTHEKWNLPAGIVEEKETLEKTAIKEAKEETGYDVKLVRKIATYQWEAHKPPQNVFEAKIVGGKLGWPEEEILQAKWFTWEEIQAMKGQLRDKWVVKAIRDMER